jgi:fatty acyl-CoA reductase
MEAPSSIAAVFDLDGTLFSGHVWYAVVQHHKNKRVNRRWLYLYLASHMPLWPLYKLGIVSNEQSRYAWTRDMGWTLRGFNQARATAMFNSITDEYVVPLLRGDVVERLRHHQAQGHHVILLSGTFEGLLVTIGERLDVDGVLGTRLVQRNGVYSGSVMSPICQGLGKVQRLQDYVWGQGRALDLAASYAYADSITDLPVLEAVGHPVAVYPEEELAVLADQRGWPILGTPS